MEEDFGFGFKYDTIFDSILDAFFDFQQKFPKHLSVRKNHH